MHVGLGRRLSLYGFAELGLYRADDYAGADKDAVGSFLGRRDLGRVMNGG
jgi:hypothetical protein